MGDFLLGLKQVPFDKGHLTFTYNPPAEVIFLAVLVFALLSWFTYRRHHNAASLASRLGLALLRTLALVLVFMCALGPKWTSAETSNRASSIAVLVDVSASMDRVDSNKSEEQARADAWAAGLTASPATEPGVDARSQADRLSRSALVARILANPQLALGTRLAKDFTVRPYEFANIVREQGTQAEGFDRDSTALGGAIRDTVSRIGSGNPVAILLFSDGGFNYGTHPIAAARAARKVGLPVFVVGVGGTLPAKDIVLDAVDCKETVFKGDEIVFSTTASARGYDGFKTTVSFYKGGAAVEQREINLPADGRKVPIEFRFKPTEKGEYTFTVSIPVEEHEVTGDNNSRTVVVRAVDEKIKVLYASGSANWEYRHLRNALLRDSSVACSLLLQRGDGTWFFEGGIEIRGFPSTPAEISRYDVVILQDVALTGFIGSDALSALDRFVGEGGGGLIYVAGEMNGTAPLAGTPLASILPVRPSSVRTSPETCPAFRPRLTIEGEKHPAFRFALEEEENRKIWNALPGIQWYYPVGEVKPGAEVLLEHPSATFDGKPVPLAVQAYYGGGRVYFSAIDSFWRWRYEVGDRYFYRYWSQLIRFCATERILGGGSRLSIATDLAEYRPGSVVRVTARALDKEFKPIPAPQLDCVISGPDGGNASVALTREQGRGTAFSGEYQPMVPGKYTLRVLYDGASAERTFEVKFVSPEQASLTQNVDLLKLIAAESGGQYFSTADLAGLFDAIPRRNATDERTISESLLAAPLIYLALILLLACEWVWRRMIRLM
ncbi:MAG: hypothetical protein WC712_03860 [Candidatus Brocadiia bacterium]